MSMPSFAEFWARYPRRVNKGQAERTWHGLTTATKWRVCKVLTAHKLQWAYEQRDRKYIPHASTWLRSDPWDSELTPYTGPPLDELMAEGKTEDGALRYAMFWMMAQDARKRRNKGKPAQADDAKLISWLDVQEHA